MKKHSFQVPETADAVSIAQDKARMIRETLNLGSFPVGVRFVWLEETSPEGFTVLSGHRFCQALMKARRGEKVSLNAEGISCPAAAAAFGFKPLPEGLASGKGLVGFGITSEDATGRAMFKGMDSFPMGKLQTILLYPIENADAEPDVIVIEDEAEKLMWVALAYLNATGGLRVDSSTAILQAACVDSTILPFNRKKLNLSYGCYGCRDATDIERGEAILGFPYSFFNAVSDYLSYLGEKAIRNSRGKNAWEALKNSERAVSRKPFR
jgi:uncharacterized protein (DUF169 family)